MVKSLCLSHPYSPDFSLHFHIYCEIGKKREQRGEKMKPLYRQQMCFCGFFFLLPSKNSSTLCVSHKSSRLGRLLCKTAKHKQEKCCFYLSFPRVNDRQSTRERHPDAQIKIDVLSSVIRASFTIFFVIGGLGKRNFLN